MTVFSGFLREGWDANVSTLYDDRQLCIYCLFIVDLYIKEMSILYIISIHTEILKYYDLVFEVGIEKQYLQSTLL